MLDKIKENSLFEFKISEESAGMRVDKFISDKFSEYSRSFLQKLFSQGHVKLNDSKIMKAGNKLKYEDSIQIRFPQKEELIQRKEVPSDIGVEIVAKEDDFFIINKPAGLVVHPPNSRFQDIALTDWLKKNYKEIEHVGLVDRPGIVHRLDRDTSGLMIIPRTNQAHSTISDMFKNREIKKSYIALVSGHPEQEGTIDFYVGRHPATRNKMAHFTELTKHQSSRTAKTDYSVLKYFDNFSMIEARPTTGRTHQIRVHFSAIKHPLISDELYGSKSKLIKRHALHASNLKFNYKGKEYKFSSKIKNDMERVINLAEKESKAQD